MKHYLIFAGTTEGRKLIEFLINKSNIYITACTATEYGKILLPQSQQLRILSKRMNEDQMFELMQQNHFDVVFDTTHPYAVIVSQNIKAAATRANLPYYRILRPTEEIESNDNIIYVQSMDEAISYLQHTTGNILCTTGSKELPALCNLPDYEQRVYVRILPNPQMVQESFDFGFRGKHLICMQGPFSEALNIALIHQFEIAYLLTKNSGKLGGFLEKINSVKATGIKAVVIGRPILEAGISLEDVFKLISQETVYTSTTTTI